MSLRLPPGPVLPPLAQIGRRIGVAAAIVVVNWVIVLWEREGYRDSADGVVSVTDALYYTTVTLSTTGYGDITPVTDAARLTNALLVTPMRFLFVLVLVGTTIEVLTQRSREQFRTARWRARVKDHLIVCGYGTKGRSAIRALLQNGAQPDRILVVESDYQILQQALADGFPTIHGSSTSEAVLRNAQVERAATAIVAVDRDDTAVLTTLTLRRLAPAITIVAAVRETENADLLRHSGASSVIVTSDAAGRLLGLATQSPATVALVEDLLVSGNGLDLAERAVAADEVGTSARKVDGPVLAVVRDGRRLAFDDPEATRLHAGDRLIFVSSPNSRET